MLSTIFFALNGQFNISEHGILLTLLYKIMQTHSYTWWR